ncbi:MAG: Gfo/Idh/MocA family oxidoreductase [Candidatus Omnitrophica bacterium]|nr:Gfo/Idh/MocA family oxidoreductase [Candidatus Omnitrophota bacterium]
MDNNKVKFALIGCGAIADKHVAAIERLDNAEIVGACDINSAAAEEFIKKYSIATYMDVEKMISDTNPDILIILTPSADHEERIAALIRFNKHFVVEKPLALKVSHIDKIFEECREKELKIFVVQQNRFNPPIQKLKEAMDKGRFGKLVLGTVRIRWRRDQDYYDKKAWRGILELGGGILANQANHHIDILMWMMGDVESVVAKAATRLTNIKSEDTVVVILKFKNGALGIIEATTAARPKDLEGSISILGEKGSVEIGGFFMNELKIWNFLDFDEMDKSLWERYAKVPDEFAWSHTKFFKNVVENIKYNNKWAVDAFGGRKSAELVNCIYKSIETGREVFLDSLENFL